MPGITSLRGIAALWVVAYHMIDHMPPSLPDWFWLIFAHGYLGVDIFFVMSGFIISYVHLNEFKTPNRGLFLEFMLKRIARIYPLHIFMLLTYLSIPVAIFLFSSSQMTRSAYSAESFVLNVFLLHATGIIDYTSWNFPSWSISVEFFSYLLFPVIAWFTTASHQKHYPSIMFACCLVLIATFFRLDGRDDLNVLFGFSMIRGVLEFAAGCFLLRMYRQDPEYTLRQTFVIASACVLLATFALPHDYVFWPAVSAFIIVAAANPGLVFRPVLLFPALVFIGEISYSIYMSHAYIRRIFRFVFVDEGQPLDWGIILLYFVTLFAVSSVLYFIVEKPSRVWIRQIGARFLKPTP